MFDHINNTLFGHSEAVAMHSWNGYTELLRDLLSTPEYCRFLSQDLYSGFVTELTDYLRQPRSVMQPNTYETALKLLGKFMQQYPDQLDYSEQDTVTDWLPSILQTILGYCKDFFSTEKAPGSAGETDRVLLEALNAFLRCQAMNATDLVKDMLPVMSKYWSDQWSTKKHALKEELVQSVRIFIRCGYAHDHARELASLMGQYDMPALRTRNADSAAARSRVGQEPLVRYDRWKFAYCDFAADIFHCLYSQQALSLQGSGDEAVKQEAQGRAEVARKRPRLSDTHEGDEIFHRFPPIAKFAEPSQDSPVWFQILFAMLAKYPTIVGAESCLTLLQLMCGSLSRMQEFGEAQAWIVLCLRQLLYIEDQVLDGGQVLQASGTAASSESQSSESSQRSWERKSEQRASRASKRKELWQVIWAGCVSAVKACVDVGAMRELLMLLEAIMLTDRVSSASVQEADELFSWDAHVIKHPIVSRAVWRFLFVRASKYPIDERKTAETLMWICTNLRHTGDHLHENVSMMSSFLAVVGGLTRSSVVCTELICHISTPVLASPVDLRQDDRIVEETLQLLNDHTILFDQSLEIKSLLGVLESHAMDTYFLAKLPVGNLTDPQEVEMHHTKLVRKLESEVVKFADSAASSSADEARDIKNLCTVCVLHLALRGCSCQTDKMMAQHLVEIRRKFEGMFANRRLWETRTQIEALKSLHHVLSLFQTLDIMSALSDESHSSAASAAVSRDDGAILREPIKLLSQSFVRYSDECKICHAGSLAADDDMADDWGGSTSSKLSPETSHAVMLSLTQVLMRLASLLYSHDEPHNHSHDELIKSMVRIATAEMTQYGTISCLEALDVKFPRFKIVVELILKSIQETTRTKANLAMAASWPDCVMRACRFLYTSCPGYVQELSEEQLSSALLLFRVLNRNKNPDDNGQSYSVRPLSRQGRRAFAECFKCVMTDAQTSDHKFSVLASVEEKGVGETMFHLLRDTDFGVRACMADVITIMCSGFLDDQDICETVEDFVPSHSDDLERQCTTVLTLGKLATAAEPLERNLLFVLLNFATGKTPQDEVFCLVKNAIVEVAKNRGHASASDLCGWHMHSWLQTWTQPAAAGDAHRRFSCLAGMNQKIENFPFRACGIENLQEFFTLHRGIILLECCLSEDAEAYNRLLQAVNRAAGSEIAVAGDQISDLYPLLHAHYLLNGANQQPPSTTASLDAFLESNFARGGGFDIKQLQRKRVDKTLVCMFSCLCPDQTASMQLSVCDHTLKHPGLEKVCAASVRGPSEFSAQTLGNLLSQAEMKGYKKQLCDRGSGAQIVAKIHEDLCGGLNRLATKVNLLCALMLCVQQLDRKSADPYIHRYVVHICVQHLTSPEVRDLCQAILVKICSIDIRDNGGLNTALHLRDVISALASSTPEDDTEIDDSMYVAELLAGVKSHDLRNIRDALVAVTPLPPKLRVNDTIAETIQQLKRASKAHSLMSELQRFVREDSADPTSQLSHLQQFLHATIGDHMSDTSNSILDLDDESTHVVSQCMWKLINLCGSGKPAVSGSNSVEQLASICLGELGPVCSHLISFSSDRNSDREVSTDELARNVKLLLLLDGYQVESSKNVVQTARRTLHAILNEEKGKQAFLWLRDRNDPRHKYMEVHCKGSAEPLAKCEWVSIDNPDIWSTQDKSYSEWVCGLCSACIAYSCDDPVLAKCFELSKFKDDFAEFVLPYAIYEAVKMGGRDGMAISVLSTYIGKCLEDQHTSRQRSIELLLRVLNLLRRMRVAEVLQRWKQTRKTQGKRESAKGNTVYYLNIDYLVAAKAALGCDAYFTALLYVEQHSEQQNGQVVPLENAGMPKLRLHHDDQPEDELLLQKIYSSINEPDGFYGVNNSLNVQQRIQSFEHEKSWDKALGAYDSLLQPKRSSAGRASSPTGGDDSVRTGLLSSLQKMGYMHMLDTYCRGAGGQITPAESVALQEFQYEAAWRACKWDEQLGHQLLEKGMPLGFHASIFKCIQALKSGDHETFSKTLETGRLSAIQELRSTSLESTKNVYSTLSKLQLYVVAEDALQVSRASSKSELSSLAQQWCKNVTNRENSVREHFAFVEPVIALQVSLLDALECQQLIPACLVDMASCARKAERFPVAAAALEQLFGNDQTASNAAGLLEEARGLWAQGDDDKAVGLARYIIDEQKCRPSESSNSADKAILSDALRLAGKWMASNRSESSDVITRECLVPAIQEASRLKDDSRSLKAKYVMATYCENLFRSLQQNDTVRQDSIQTQEEEVRRWESSKNDKENRGILAVLKKQLSQDKDEYENLRREMERLVATAITNYVECLGHLPTSSGKYDIRVVFKLVSLWFEIHDQFSKVNSIVGKRLETDGSFPYHKFIPLTYQIVSRLGPTASGAKGKFQTVLQQLIFNMAKRHPHHCLYQIFALQNGERIASSIRNSKGFVAPDQGKTQAAKLMIDKLRTDGGHGELIGQMTVLLEAYLELSEKPPNADKAASNNNRAKITPKLRAMRDLPLVPATTVDIPIEPTCDYNRWVKSCHVCAFDGELQFVGGINKPMRITCAGPHGQRFNQLLKAMNDKGGDDLRQDSVMQQVFDVANTLLHNNIETRRRALCVRTFKVIPMTPCVGLIEWCDNTTPIGLYLLGNEGAHRRYRPQDMKDSACREKMKVLQEGSSMSERACLKLYKEITTKFRPVFHHFFLERFPQPAQWFERRLAYTRSVAASSIVGYIVGLGDRHSHNILVDQATAAVIHIDLGVAFEQGKLLKTPETVPFRLTRDLVAGMGVTGCDGAFLRCAEETLGTLRDNKESLLTVLEVFFHDPLYKWAISPVKIAKLQHRATHDHGAEEKRGGGGGGVGGGRSGAHAERVLARLRQKLDGFESGHLLSAKGQVKVLVNGATDSSCLLLLLLRALA
jgi:hypothetical protein